MEKENENFPIHEEGFNAKDLGGENVSDYEPGNVPLKPPCASQRTPLRYGDRSVSSGSDKNSTVYDLIWSLECNNAHKTLMNVHEVGENVENPNSFEDVIAMLKSHVQKFTETKSKFKEMPAAEHPACMTSEDDQSELAEDEKWLTCTLAKLLSGHGQHQIKSETQETDVELGTNDIKVKDIVDLSTCDSAALKALLEPVLAQFSSIERIVIIETLKIILARHSKLINSMMGDIADPAYGKLVIELVQEFMAKIASAQLNRETPDKNLRADVCSPPKNEAEKIVAIANEKGEERIVIRFASPSTPCRTDCVQSLKGDLNNRQVMKADEKAAKKAANEERRNLLECERLQQLNRLQEERHLQEEMVDHHQHDGNDKSDSGDSSHDKNEKKAQGDEEVGDACMTSEEDKTDLVEEEKSVKCIFAKSQSSNNNNGMNSDSTETDVEVGSNDREVYDIVDLISETLEAIEEQSPAEQPACMTSEDDQSELEQEEKCTFAKGQSSNDANEINSDSTKSDADLGSTDRQIHDMLDLCTVDGSVIVARLGRVCASLSWKERLVNLPLETIQEQLAAEPQAAEQLAAEQPACISSVDDQPELAQESIGSNEINSEATESNNELGINDRNYNDDGDLRGVDCADHFEYLKTLETIEEQPNAEQLSSVTSDDDQFDLAEEEVWLTCTFAKLQSCNSNNNINSERPETDVVDLSTYDSTALEVRFEPMLAGLSWIERIEMLETLVTIVARHSQLFSSMAADIADPARAKLLLELLREFMSKKTSAQQNRETPYEDLRGDRFYQQENETENSDVTDDEKGPESVLIESASTSTADITDRAKSKHDRNKRRKKRAAQKATQKAIEDAKKAAKVERRRVLECERLARLQEERREQEEKDEEQRKIVRERKQLAREKARKRKEQKSAARQTASTTADEDETFVQEQEENEQNPQKNIELIRRCLSDNHSPSNAPYPILKYCVLCNVFLKSDAYVVSHLRGSIHVENVKKAQGDEQLVGDALEIYSVRQIVSAPRDKVDLKIIADDKRRNMVRKQNKRIKQRLATKAAKYQSSAEKLKSDKETVDSKNKRTLVKNVKAMTSFTKQLTTNWRTSTCTQLERLLKEMTRMLEKQSENDLRIFQQLNAFEILATLLSYGLQANTQMQDKTVIVICNLWLTACEGPLGTKNCDYAICSNGISVFIELLNISLQKMVDAPGLLPSDSLCSELLHVVYKIMMNLRPKGPDKRAQDVVSFAVSSGVVDQITTLLSSVRSSIDEDSAATTFILNAVNFLYGLVLNCPENSDPTDYLSTAHDTELMGMVSMMYSIFMLPDLPSRLEVQSPPIITEESLGVMMQICYFLHYFAGLDLRLFQKTLGAEGTSLLFLHTVSYLIWCCSSIMPQMPKHTSSARYDKLAELRFALVNEVISIIGYFAVDNIENQMLLVSEHPPHVLQELAGLSVASFKNNAKSEILFATLLACTVGNTHTTAILKEEMSYEPLEAFRASPIAEDNMLLKLLKE